MIQIMPFCGGSYYAWDKSKGQLMRAHHVLIFNTIAGALMGIFFACILAVQLYLKLTWVDDEALAADMSLREFGCQMILIGEMLLCLCIMFLNLVCAMHVDDMIYLMNQILAYNNSILEMMKSKNLQLDPFHKKNMRLMDFLITATATISVVLPFGLAGALFHPMEPTHIIFEEWLEIKVGFHGLFIPFYFATCAAMFGSGNIVAIMCWNIACYFVIATTILNDIKPEELERRIGNGTRCQVRTRFYGVMGDQEVVTFYRIQKLFNVLVTDLYASVLVAFHHVALMATVAIMLYFTINFQELLWNGGPIAISVVLGSIFIPLVIIRMQCMMCGYLVDISDEFKDQAWKVVRRNCMLKKFAKSCDTLYVQVAYPFYTVHRETFLLFCSQVADYTITLLLW
ncbi:unnamed protein product [Orchesella dallaii]|uniref:Odorant receptor n=1 Tax=Orchesella dallaii TaxID=48710 RepID=A0ABP1QXU8_9HEXA